SDLVVLQRRLGRTLARGLLRADRRRGLLFSRATGGGRLGLGLAHAKRGERFLVELAARLDALRLLELLQRGLGPHIHLAVGRDTELLLYRGDELRLLGSGRVLVCECGER